jgi:hypothetical protein
MKLVEELKFGDCFKYKESYFILTNNFRIRDKKTQNQVISLITGSSDWINADSIVHIIGLYTTSDDNNIIAIKEYKDDYQDYK